ncbi:MAG: hypothetical protein V7L11_05110 [Nostoc sp.]|uniref:hypothetical protein n=1 Tax=Nostoc sp. TaxID=1180 RepID=UPI002FFAC205
MERIIRSNAVETSSQGDSSEMNLYNLYPYYELALAKTSLLGELSAKITKTLLNSAEKFQPSSLPLKAAGANQNLGKFCTRLLIDFYPSSTFNTAPLLIISQKRFNQLQKG